MSRLLKGVAASGGVAVGPIHLYRHELPPLPQGEPEDADAEVERFHQAVERVAAHLGRLEEKTRAEIGDDAAQIFSAHALFLEDPSLTDPIEEEIRRGAYAEAAVAEVPNAGEFEAMEEEYFVATPPTS